jgi:hypothetical protein
MKHPDDGQRNCPKHVEIYPKNKFEKLVHLVGFIIKIYMIFIFNYIVYAGDGHPVAIYTSLIC